MNNGDNQEYWDKLHSSVKAMSDEEFEELTAIADSYEYTDYFAIEDGDNNE